MTDKRLKFSRVQVCCGIICKAAYVFLLSGINLLSKSLALEGKGWGQRYTRSFP